MAHKPRQPDFMGEGFTPYAEGNGSSRDPQREHLEVSARPLAADLFCGLGGWTEGLLAEGWKYGIAYKTLWAIQRRKKKP